MLANDVDIQRWVEDRYGFVPHPFWINHCKELCGLASGQPAGDRKCWHECPPEKQLILREAFAHFGLLADQEVAVMAAA
jgi:hypothetical protein